MLLLADIGNTTTAIGFFENGTIDKILRFATVPGARRAEEFSNLIRGFMARHGVVSPEGAAICSVVPEDTDTLISTVKTEFGIAAMKIHYSLRSGLTFAIPYPDRLGADRIANAAAAHRLYPGNKLVVDFGTATTFCAVSTEGRFLGGAIMPGAGLSARVLSEKTAKLPAVTLRSPGRILGEDTTGGIVSGIILGQAGAADRLVQEISGELKDSVTVIATGGHAGFIAPHMKVDHINPLLTIQGIQIIYEMNA